MSANDTAKSAEEPAISSMTVTESTKEGQPASYTEMASNAAGSTAESASNAAVGVKDAVFSMFGGGAKKEKKEDEGAEEDRSGSSKAIKQKEAEDKGEEGGEGGDVR